MLATALFAGIEGNARRANCADTHSSKASRHSCPRARRSRRTGFGIGDGSLASARFVRNRGPCPAGSAIPGIVHMSRAQLMF